MSILTDKELVQIIQSGKIMEFEDPPKDWFDKKSPIQPSSIDMHIGKIFLPEINRDNRGGITNPKMDYHTLKPGESAFVETKEKLNVPADISGFGFPPASTAVKGILMTNPGHIDPGFNGNLTFTLINMGKDPFTIRRDDILFTTLWVRLPSEVGRDYKRRTGLTESGANEANIDVLSKDFLNVQNRAKEEARKAVKNSALIASILALVISAFIAFFQYALTNSSAVKKEIEKLSSSMAVLETKLEERDSKMVSELQKEIDVIKAKIDKKP